MLSAQSTFDQGLVIGEVLLRTAVKLYVADLAAHLTTEKVGLDGVPKGQYSRQRIGRFDLDVIFDWRD